jgi:hypothetical protein
MIIYFYEQPNLSSDAKLFYLIVYGISVIFWPFVGVYSYLRLNGKGHEIIDKAFEHGGLMIFNGAGALLHLLLPFFILVNIEHLGFIQRLSIMVLFLLFLCTVLFYILKITKYKKT